MLWFVCSMTHSAPQYPMLRFWRRKVGIGIKEGWDPGLRFTLLWVSLVAFPNTVRGEVGRLLSLISPVPPSWLYAPGPGAPDMRAELVLRAAVPNPGAVADRYLDSGCGPMADCAGSKSGTKVESSQGKLSKQS